MKIHINEKQARLIVESELTDAMKTPLPEFVKESPLAKTGVFVEKSLEKIVGEREKAILAYFSDDIASFNKDEIFTKLSKLVAKAKELEEPIRGKLEKICSNVVVETFQIPEDTVVLSTELVPEISATKSYHIKPDTDEDYEYNSVSDIEAYDLETNKRRIINALSYGAAQNFAEQSKKLWINDVFELSETLPHIYSSIMKINDYLVFNTDIQISDKSHKQGGDVEVSLTHDDEISSVKATGVLFPILLQETMRGIIDIISTFGLPEDVAEARRVINVADALENDPINMRLGPAMWKQVVECVPNFKTEEFPHFYKMLVELSADEFISLMKEVLAGTKKGKEEIAKIYGESKYNDEYEKFANDLALRRGKDVIADDCFTEDELERGL